MKKTVGFTLRELVVVVMVGAVIMLLVLPSLGINSNEAWAMRTLRAIHDAEVNYKEMQFSDANKNGVGEYGDFAALKEAKDRATKEPLLKVRFVGDSGSISTGYHFIVGVGANGNPDDITAREQGWSAYAWPNNPGVTGNRTFCIDPFGEITATGVTVFNADGTQRPTRELVGKLKWTPVKSEE